MEQSRTLNQSEALEKNAKQLYQPMRKSLETPLKDRAGKLKQSTQPEEIAKEPPNG